MTEKYVGVTLSVGTSTASSGRKSGRPSMLKLVDDGVAVRKIVEIAAAPCTPGMPLSRAVNCR